MYHYKGGEVGQMESTTTKAPENFKDNFLGQILVLGH